MESKRPRSIQQLEQALREKTREADVLHRISESISNTLDLEAVLKHIVEVVVEATKAEACLLYLLSESREELILRASKNPHPKLSGRITIGLGEGITGWVARERTRVVIPSNANDDPRFKFFHNLPEDRYQAFVSVPIMAKKEVVGVINVQHKRPRRYRPDELALLSTIANQVGGAIENARLYEEMKRKALQLDTLSQVSETVASNRLIEDIFQLIVAMTAPMMIRDKAVGVINSYTSVPHAFTHEEVKVMQAIANQAAIAIEHTTLLEKSFEMQEALAVRKLVERAKGYLMRSKKLSEEEAFRLIQRQSMDLRKSMREIAEAILLAEEIEERADEKQV